MKKSIKTSGPGILLTNTLLRVCTSECPDIAPNEAV